MAPPPLPHSSSHPSKAAPPGFDFLSTRPSNPQQLPSSRHPFSSSSSSTSTFKSASASISASSSPYPAASITRHSWLQSSSSSASTSSLPSNRPPSPVSRSTSRKRNRSIFEYSLQDEGMECISKPPPILIDLVDDSPPPFPSRFDRISSTSSVETKWYSRQIKRRRVEPSVVVLSHRSELCLSILFAARCTKQSFADFSNLPQMVGYARRRVGREKRERVRTTKTSWTGWKGPPYDLLLPFPRCRSLPHLPPPSRSFRASSSPLSIRNRFQLSYLPTLFFFNPQNNLLKPRVRRLSGFRRSSSWQSVRTSFFFVRNRYNSTSTDFLVSSSNYLPSSNSFMAISRWSRVFVFGKEGARQEKGFVRF